MNDVNIEGEISTSTINLEASVDCRGPVGPEGKMGPQGHAIGKVEKTSGTGAAGTIDTYTMYLNDEKSTPIGTFDVYNGFNGEGTGIGDMLKSIYDTDNDGIVDNSKKVNGYTVEKDVPLGAKFTDTTYSKLSEFHDDVGFLTEHQDISNKVDKIEGKGLSTNDYTTAEKNKLGSIEDKANKTIVDSSISSTSTNTVQNKVIKDYVDNYSVTVKEITDSELANYL